MRKWKYRDDSSNKDYRKNKTDQFSGAYRRLVDRGIGNPKFLLYVAKDYPTQIIALRWQFTDYDPSNSEHLAKAQSDLQPSQAIFKLWNQVVTLHPLPRNLSLNQYIDLLDEGQIDDIFTDYLSGDDFSYVNINTPHQFLTYQNTDNPHRRIMIFDNIGFRQDSINKKLVFA